jgi:hypothetical protein
MKQKIETECGILNIETDKEVRIFKDRIAPTSKEYYNILWVCEPRAILEGFGILNNQSVKNSASDFDAILTFDEDLLPLPNAYKLLYGTTWIYDDFEFKEKIFQISFLVGGKNITVGHKLRHELYDHQKLIINPIDFYVSSHMPRRNQFNNKYVDNRYDLFHSQFHVAIENSRQNNYFTEKVMDCFKTKTIPIYYGCPNIAEYFDVDGMIIVESKEEIIEACNSINEDTYHSKLPHVENNYKLCENYDNLSKRMENKINSIVERV